MSEIPAALRNRKPHEVEDILCIYKDWFNDRGGDRWSERAFVPARTF